jgi:hypothetical protein
MPDMSQHDIREFMAAFRDNVGGHIDLEFDNGPGHLQCLVDGESRALAPTSMPASRSRSHVMQTTATTGKRGNKEEEGREQKRNRGVSTRTMSSLRLALCDATKLQAVAACTSTGGRWSVAGE